MYDIETHSLFTIPIFETRVEVTDNILESCKLLSYKRTSFENSFISHEMNVLSLKDFERLKNEIGKNVMHVLCDVCKLKTDISVEITSSWINIHKPGDYAQSHNHMNSVLSGVLYLKTPENCGDIVFESPTNLFGTTFVFEVVEDNNLNSSSRTFSPTVNTLYLFPSHLRHYVQKNMSNDDRISLAFNCYIRTNVMSENKMFTV